MVELRANSPVRSSVTTAVPVYLPPEAENLYSEVLTALNENGVPYAVAGAVSLEKYTGIWRETKDLDLFMESQNGAVLTCTTPVRRLLTLTFAPRGRGAIRPDVIVLPGLLPGAIRLVAGRSSISSPA